MFGNPFFVGKGGCKNGWMFRSIFLQCFGVNEFLYWWRRKIIILSKYKKKGSVKADNEIKICIWLTVSGKTTAFSSHWKHRPDTREDSKISGVYQKFSVFLKNIIINGHIMLSSSCLVSGWLLAIGLSRSHLAESQSFVWVTAIWLSCIYLAKSQLFGWVPDIWLSPSHLAESKPFGWVPAIWLAPIKLQLNCLTDIWLSSSHLDGIQPKKDLIGWLNLQPSQPVSLWLSQLAFGPASQMWLLKF